MKNLLLNGLSAFSRHSKLWFVGALLLLLPGAFLVAFSNIYKATDANTKTIEIQRINSYQDLVTVLLTNRNQAELVSEVDRLVERVTDVRRVVILEEVAEGFVIRYHTEEGKAGTLERSLDGFRAAVVKPGETIIFPVVVDGRRAWQAYRYLPETNYYFLTEHQFTSLETLLTSRWYQVYLILTLVFTFIIALAFWLMRQIDFERRYNGLKKKLQERDLIAEGMVHELRAPLTAMRGYASLIEENLSLPATEREYAKRISQSAARLVDLVSDFLRAAKVHSNEVTITSQPADIAALLNRIRSQFASEVEAKKLKFEINNQLDPNEALYTDEKRLEQILINLVSNAIKYTPKGTISLSVDQNFRSTIFTVADTGSGMSAEDQKKLFAPFVRVGDSATQAKITGTGLGMWLTKEMAEQLKGSIGVESIKGVGTHVIVTIPNRISASALENRTDKL